MPNNIDSLEIKIKANATTANNALEKLVANIEKLEIGLSSINATPMKELANGVSIMGRFGIPCIGLGPGKEEEAHAPNEKTWKYDLVKCAAIYAAVPNLYVLNAKEEK